MAISPWLRQKKKDILATEAFMKLLQCFLWQLSILYQYQVQQDRSVCAKCCNCSNWKQIISPFLTKYKVLASSVMNAFFSSKFYVKSCHYQGMLHETTCFGDATGSCDHRSFTVRACLHYFIFVITFRVHQDIESYTVKICFFTSLVILFNYHLKCISSLRWEYVFQGHVAVFSRGLSIFQRLDLK